MWGLALPALSEKLLRRAASEAQYSKVALFLYRLADDVEAEAREAELISPPPASE
jgi:hypothetical protein